MSEIVATAGPDSAGRRVPSIWMFLAADSITFSIFFLVFMIERVKQPALFAASARSLDASTGLVNTMILITGSWLVALALDRSRQGDGAATRRLLLAAAGVSSGFAVVKGFEYAAKVGAGITPVTNDFYAFYYALTGFHLVHYLLGMAALVYLASTVRAQLGDPRYGVWLESGALFWHLVDLLWIFIFAMLYLLGGEL
ncbi:MAG: cytochrome c oxidase subunit 3 [Gammaproteobacteria bacterium]